MRMKYLALNAISNIILTN